MTSPRSRPQRGTAYNPTMQRLFTGLHTFWYRLAGGRVGGRMGKSPVLILTTTGRRSGRPRSTPLYHREENGVYAIVASNGGSPTHPLWWRNLQARPEATIEVGARRIAVRASEATRQERERL